MSAIPGYEVRPFTEADEPEVRRVMADALGPGPVGARTHELFRWKHLDGHFGASGGAVALHDGQVVGFRLLMPWRWRAGAQVHHSLRAVDAAVVQQHQGRGLMRLLTDIAIRSLAGPSDLVMSTPNPRSRAGHLKMGWSQVGTVPVAIRPRRPLRFALGVRRVRDGSTGTPIDCHLAPADEAFAAPEAVAGLLEHVANGDGRLTTDRSAEYLRWRYAHAADLDYRHVAVHRGGELVGLAFARPRWRGSLAELTVSEVLVPRGDRTTARALLRELGRGSGCDHLATVTGLDRDLSGAFIRSGFVAPPGQGIVVTARPLVDATPDPADPASWAFSLGDLEVF